MEIDFMDYQKPQAVPESKKPMTMGRILLFLLAVSIFSFLLSCHSSWPRFLRFIKLLSTEFFTNGLHYFMHNKAMLLFFNVILLYLTRNFGLLGTPQFLQDVHDGFVSNIGNHQRLRPESFEVEPHVEDTEVIVESVRPLELPVVEGGAKDKLVEVHELELLGIDELNKRFEEFIEREKRKRRLEALQLVMV